MNRLQIIPKHAQSLFINGPVGKLECLKLIPNNTEDIKGIAIVFHPNPTAGGTNTNKIVQTITKVLNLRGFICYCPNLRGVGLSDGEHDYGVGEIDDALAIYKYIQEEYSGLPLIISGFSFGAAIASNLAIQVEHQTLILVGPSVVNNQVVIPDKNKTIVIHGEEDEIVALKDVLAWAKTNEQPIMWVPNTGHFFHGKLSNLHAIINNFLF